MSAGLSRFSFRRAWDPFPLRKSAVLAGALLVLLGGNESRAEEPIYEGERTTWSLGVGVTGAAFTQSSPWFGRDVANIGAETDEWLELGVTPSLSFTVDTGDGGEFFGALSAVATQTLGESADGLAVGDDDPGSVTLEQLNLGWRRSWEEDGLFEIIGGNFDYEIGTGFLVKDGGSDGGGRGGFYLGARSAFRESGLIRVKHDGFLAELFYLGNNPRRGSLEGHIAGINFEYEFPGRAKLGGAYIDVVDIEDPVIDDYAEKLRTYDLRAEGQVNDHFGLAGEYAWQDGGPFEGDGWWAQAKLSFEEAKFSPTVLYRYAALSGDDPDTAELEGFEPLTYGFSDYETWYQGEIAGNWIFANTNLRTHLLMATFDFSDAVTLTAAFLNIQIDEPAAIGATSDEFGNELDLIVDWQVSERFAVSGALAFLDPDRAAKEFTGGDNTWTHAMVYFS
jgi:hypothetical protein